MQLNEGAVSPFYVIRFGSLYTFHYNKKTAFGAKYSFGGADGNRVNKGVIPVEPGMSNTPLGWHGICQGYFSLF